MKLDFVKISPSQNMTALITSYVEPANYAQVGSTVMAYEYVHTEQAGFTVDPMDDNAVVRLEMSGGEFCGNAVLAAAAYARYREFCSDKRFTIETSGAKAPLLCEVTTKSPVVYEAKGEMPHALSITDTVIAFGDDAIFGTFVQLEGITHFITDVWPDTDDFFKMLQSITNIIQDKAIGIVPFKYVNDQTYEIRPFVYVTETGTTSFERSCGSGTLALGIYLADQLTESTFTIKQPGGTIQAEIGDKNYIATDVHITCEGVVHLPD